MSYNGGNAKYPGAIATLADIKDKVGVTTFETAGWVISQAQGNAKAFTIPSQTPYVVRLEFVPQETRDASGNPIGVAIAGMQEVVWDASSSPVSGKFMVNYINGEVKFNADKAGQSLTPEYTGVATWGFAELWNEERREIKAIMQILGINPHGGFDSVKDRLAAIEAEMQAARGGQTNLNTRLNGMQDQINPMTGATATSQEPSAQTGVLATAAIEISFDLDVKEATVIDGCIIVKNSLNVTQTINTPTLGADGKTITATHDAFLDDVYTVTISGLQDTLGRAITMDPYTFGVGAAVANDKPNVTGLTITNQSIAGFTASGTVTDTENDTITRVDIGYSQTNDPATATIQQLVGADITALTGAGKVLSVALADGQWYAWARAVEQLPGGGTQVGDWCAAVPFTVQANVSPVVSALANQNPATTGIDLKGTITDNESDSITGLKIQITLNSDTNWASPVVDLTLTAAGDIQDFMEGVGAAWYSVAATLSAGSVYKYRAQAKDSGSGVYGDWVEGAATFTVPSGLSRTSTGKILYEDFSGGNLGQFANEAGYANSVVESGRAKVVKDVTNIGHISASFSADNRPVYITFKRQCVDADSTYNIALFSGSDYYKWQVNDQARFLGKNTTVLVTESYPTTATAEKNCAFKISSGNLTAYEDGAQILTAADNTLTSFNKVGLLGGSNTVGDGAYFDNVAVCKDYQITCNNMPTGYKLRIGGASGPVATESAGVVTVDCSGVMFPQSLVEMLDGSNNVVLSLTLTADVWGGDAYSYPV